MNDGIILSTINARFHHAAFGLRYIKANMEELGPRTQMLEFTTGQGCREIAEEILRHRPRILGLGVYIWNTRQTLDLVQTLKSLNPNLVIVLGGPEISYETESQELYQYCDHVIVGEADFAFRDLCRALLRGDKPNKKLTPELPNIAKITSPYQHYSESDIKNRIIYVEASRGCPYRCEYCLSSLDKSVRSFHLESFLLDMKMLLDRGVRSFKFVDRTFNLSPRTSLSILEFFLQESHRGLFLHFEMVPDRLPQELRDIISLFPDGSLQFEVGIQTMNPKVAERIQRRQDYSKIQDNLQFLANRTRVHIHADLIVGLPGESLESFGKGFDQLAELRTHEIQVGILKRLKGTPITRHDQDFEMVYSQIAPFQILQNKDLSFSEIMRLQRFADYWDWYGNSGNFSNFIEFLRLRDAPDGTKSLFRQILELSDFLFVRFQSTHGISLRRQFDGAYLYLIEALGVEPEIGREVLIQDYQRGGRQDFPDLLRSTSRQRGLRSQRRQLRHSDRKGINRSDSDQPFHR